jgi:hypothetical protein
VNFWNSSRLSGLRVRRGGGDTDWIDLAQDKEKGPVPVNAIINFRAPQNAENFLTS